MLIHSKAKSKRSKSNLSSGNSVLITETLHEVLGAFQSSSLGSGPESRDCSLSEIIDEPRNERSLRAHHDEADIPVAAERDDGGAVGDVKVGDAGGVAGGGNTGVARGAEDGVAGRGAGEGVAERVLSAASADDENHHSLCSFSSFRKGRSS